MESRSPMRRGNSEGEQANHCKVYRDTAVICAKTVEPIEVPFARMGPVHMLDGGPDPI